MATVDLSSKPSEKVSAAGVKFGIVTASWNEEITFALRDGAIETIVECGGNVKDIVNITVPGTLELIYGAKHLTETRPRIDAVICIGCVIQGETPHFDYVCMGVTHGIATLNALENVPIIFGVLTVNTLLQAQERAGGRLGNKGVEAAYAAIKMAGYRVR